MDGYDQNQLLQKEKDQKRIFMDAVKEVIRWFDPAEYGVRSIVHGPYAAYAAC